MTSKVKVPSCPDDGQAGGTACRPWCAEHPVMSVACSSAYADVAGVTGLSAWASQAPADVTATVALDGYDAGGRPFDLALTPAQALSVGVVLQGLAVLGGAR